MDTSSGNNMLLIDEKILQCPNCRQNTISRNIANANVTWVCKNNDCNALYYSVENVPTFFDSQTISILKNDRHRETGLSSESILNNAVYNWSNIFLDCDKAHFDKDVDFIYHFDAVQK
ncbi:MAG: hypothetical protein M1147_01135 [Nitrospirae bacterium]|nr:hypothetical protein [Nitrospirota bacterium]MCL5976713.1 hypothetical protein [Nitrospirota bacterium]